MPSLLFMPEESIGNDNSGTLVSVINADTFGNLINNTRVQGLQNIGSKSFSAYPLVVGTDLPAKNESNYVANDNTGSLMGILNADTSSTLLDNSKLGGPLISSITGNNGITVINPSAGAGGASLGLSNVPNNVMAGPLLISLVAGTGIDITDLPSSGTGSPTISATATGNIVATATETEITSTAATTVVDYTPTTTGAFKINCFFRVTTATTDVGVTVTYYDAAAVAQTLTLVPASTSLSPDNYSLPATFIAAGSGGAIDVNVTAGTTDQVYVTAQIERMI